jgi:hypothetical protein
MLGLGDEDGRIRMARTLKLKFVPKVIVRLQQMDNLIPHLYIAACLGIANNVASMLGSRQKNIDSVRSAEEAALILGVAPDERNDDNLGLLPLKIINRSQPDTLCKSRLGN